MTQTVYVGTAGADVFNASGESASDTAVFRGISTGDEAIGGAGADRFAASGDATLDGGAGNDQFFLTLGNTPGTDHTVIDGGSGTDELIVIASSYQLTTTVVAELGRLAGYLAGDTQTTSFSSDILNLTMIGVETSNVNLGGTLTALADIVPGPTAVTQSYAAQDNAVLHVDAAHGLLTGDTALAGGLTAVAGTYTTALGGSVTVAADGSFDFTAHAGAGNDSFTYTAQDSLGRTATATADIAVSHVNTSTTIGFEDVNTTGFKGLPVTTDGFTFASSAYGEDGIINDQSYGFLGHAYAGHNWALISGDDAIMTKAGGGSFDLASVAVLSSNSHPGEHNTIDAYVGSTLAYSITPTNDNSWHDLTLNWTGVTSVHFHTTSLFAGLGFDNIVVA